MKKERITSEEIKVIQLQMLDEIDFFCRNHSIKYSLAFGTLLGAVRHNGYIPWDDDMDIIMPLPDMQIFKEEFKSEKLAYLDVDTCKDYEYHFSRICYIPTYNKTGVFTKSYGINIDLYPVVGMADSDHEIDLFLNGIHRLYKRRLLLKKWSQRLKKYLPFVVIPFYNKTMRQFRDSVLFRFPYGSSTHYLHAGTVGRVNIFDFDVFEDMMDIEFEGHRYKSMTKYDLYLTHCYGDYMQLPPEDKRHPYHGGRYYWK